jgi:hypothetical protein
MPSGVLLPKAGNACSIKSIAKPKLTIAPSRLPILGSGVDIGADIGGVMSVAEASESKGEGCSAPRWFLIICIS